MRTIERRIAAIEQRRTMPSTGMLPTIIIIPSDEPDRAAALERIEALRKQGREAHGVAEGELCDELIERCAP